MRSRISRDGWSTNNALIRPLKPNIQRVFHSGLRCNISLVKYPLASFYPPVQRMQLYLRAIRAIILINVAPLQQMTVSREVAWLDDYRR